MNDFRTDSSLSRYAGGPPPPLVVYLQQFGTSTTVPYAGFWRRFVASVIDSFLTGLVTIILINILEGVFTHEVGGTVSWTEFAVWLTINIACLELIGWLYFAGMESSTRQATFGKRMLGIVVTDLERNRISFGRASGRYFAHYLSIFLLGYLIQPFTSKRQALHDLIAGTLVVRRRSSMPRHSDQRPQ